MFTALSMHASIFFYRSTTPDYMSLEIKTEAQNGVIPWQGEVN